MYLTRAELRELTGYQMTSAIRRWLDRNNWPYAVGGVDGWPRVLRSYHDDRLAGIAAAKPKKTTHEPNWSQA